MAINFTKAIGINTKKRRLIVAAQRHPFFLARLRTGQFILGGPARRTLRLSAVITTAGHHPMVRAAQPA